MGPVWRRWAVSLGLLAGLLTGCRDGGPGGGASSTTRPDGTPVTSSSTAPGPASGLVSTWFLDERDGWALSAEPCPRPDADEARCAVVSRTTDGGGSWTRAGRLDVRTDPAGGPEYVSRIAFADPRHGWVFYRELHATFNEGKRWQAVPLGNPVVALEPAGSQAYALVGSCGSGAGNCTAPMRLFEGTIATGRWRFVTLGFDLPVTDAGSIIVNRSNVYALVTSNALEQVFVARTAVGRWERRTPPCLRAIVVAIEGEDGLVAACRPAMPGSPVELQTTSDGGKTWAVVWEHTFPSPVTAIAVTDQAAVVALENGDVLRSIDNGMNFSTVLQAGAAPGVRFTDAEHGFVVAGAPADRRLFRTTDGGATWQPMRAPR
jgi:hypothetical protein